jgi:anti-sigma factor RsiW
MPDSPERPLAEEEIAELVALADGSLPADRRPAVEARVAASPRLQALLAEQRQAVAAIRARDEAAPPSLRAALAAEHARRRPRFPPHRVRLAAALATAALLLAFALVLALPESETAAPTVAQAARLAGRASESSAPRAYPGHPSLLDLEVEEVPYPSWQRRFGWRAVGSRSDRVGGRDARTLFYERDGRRIGYTIVSGAPIPPPNVAARSVRRGIELRSLTLEGRTVVTWERRRHTCVLAGLGVSREELLSLGAWRNGGAIPY